MDEKRRRIQPIPQDLELHLTEPQLQTVHSLNKSGWILWFVRRTDCQDAMPVVIEDATGITAIIDKTGLSDPDHGLDFRGPEPLPRCSIGLKRFMKGVRMGEHLWFVDDKTGDLILAAHMLDDAARIPKNLVDLAKNDSNSIDIDLLKTRIEKDFGYHNS